MDGRRRIAESLSDGCRVAWRRSADFSAGVQRHARRWLKPVLDLKPPRGIGVAASAILLLASAGAGVVHGGHTQALTQELKDLRDTTANAFGFRLTAISLAGQRQVPREDILAAIGVNARSSLLFLDAAVARTQLKRNPWIEEATVLKLYPGRLHVAITERAAFALWQKDRKIFVISEAGIVLEPYSDGQFVSLPLVVGVGAERKAREFLTLLDKYPALRAQVHASVLVADRRWNLKLKNGIEVKLPEIDAGLALDALMKLDRDKQLLTRDIAAIDLRLPDRVTVRLPDEAAQVREDAMREREKEKDKAKSAKRKGGNA
jgi:cell division protein FtsQ